jgi:cytochrome c oxidase cbb3-type subunit IV
MYKNVLQGIDNIAIWPVISFVIFFVFFLCLLWWVFSVDKNFVKVMSEMPINDGSDDTNAISLPDEQNQSK